MKLARANPFPIRNEALDRLPPRRRLAPSAGLHRAIQGNPQRLVAHWHLCPRTQRLECRWCLEATAVEGQLCRSSTTARCGVNRRLLHVRKRVR